MLFTNFVAIANDAEFFRGTGPTYAPLPGSGRLHLLLHAYDLIQRLCPPNFA